MSRIMFTFLKLSSLSQSGLLLRLLAAVCLVGASHHARLRLHVHQMCSIDLSVQPVGQNYGSTASLSIASISAQGVMSGRPFDTNISRPHRLYRIAGAFVAYPAISVIAVCIG